MLKCDSTSAINKLWKTLNYFRQLISAYKMAAHNYFSVCVCTPLSLSVCVCEVVVLIYSCTFLKRPSQSTCSSASSGTAVAVKQFVSLMHFAAEQLKAASQVESDIGVDLPSRPSRPDRTQPSDLQPAHGTKWRNGSAFQWNLWRMETLDDRWRLQVRVAFCFFEAGRGGAGQGVPSWCLGLC